jgi:hypothetical protein
MQSAVPLFLSGLVVFLFACQQSGDNNNAAKSPASGILSTRSGQIDTPASLVHFSDAEQKLAIGEYSFAAVQLHKGIIDYRMETGKMHGNAARQANRAIDALTLLRKSLREGKAVNGIDLHLAIQNALLVENPDFRLPEQQAPDNKGLFVPVSGN